MRIKLILKRISSESGYGFYLLEKITQLFFSYLANLSFYLIRFILYRKIAFISKISFSASLRNRHKISIGNRVVVNRGVVLWAGLQQGISIDKRSQLNPYVTVYGNVKIGKYVMIAPHVMLAGGNHGFKDINIPMILQTSVSKGGITIEDDVWIGANCTILDGVIIGKGSIIGANSLVNKNIPPYSIAFGNPAIIVKTRR